MCTNLQVRELHQTKLTTQKPLHETMNVLSLCAALEARLNAADLENQKKRVEKLQRDSLGKESNMDFLLITVGFIFNLS